MSVTVRFRAEPDRTAPCRQYPHRAAQLPVRAAEAGGDFILRLDDTDRERSTEEFARGIEEDLSWLGLDWAEQVRQSDRFDRYAEAVDQAESERAGSIPPTRRRRSSSCKRKRQLARGKPPVYDRAALKLTDEEQRQARGGRAQAALALQAGAARRGRGTTWCAGGSMSTPPRCPIRCWSAKTAAISTRCPRWSTTSISASRHVIRGEDHVTNTAPQIQLFEALGRGAAGVRPPQSAGRRRRAGAVEARSALSPSRACARKGSSRSRWRATSAMHRHLRCGRAACEPRRAGRPASTFSKLSRAPARFDPRRASPAQRQTAAHAPVQRRGGSARAPWASAGGEAFWDAVAAISPCSPRRSSGGRW